MDNVSFQDFSKLDLRIGTIIEAEVPEWSHWVIKLTVEFDKEIGIKTIFAGLLGFYKPEELKGKQFPFIVNLEPKKIGPQGDYSQGMMLAGVMEIKNDPASLKLRGASEKPVLLIPSEKVPNGTKIK